MKFSLKTDTMDIWIKIWNLFFPVNGKPGGEMKKFSYISLLKSYKSTFKYE